MGAGHKAEDETPGGGLHPDRRIQGPFCSPCFQIIDLRAQSVQLGDTGVKDLVNLRESPRQT